MTCSWHKRHGRIVVTSSLANEPAWFIDRGRVSFSYQFWSAIFGKANLIEAFRQSRGVMRRYQTAMIDTNGDGLPDTDEELKLASVPNLGRGAMSAAFEPQILGVTAPQEIGASSSATWTVQGVSAVNKLSRVWSVVLPPDSGPVVPISRCLTRLKSTSTQMRWDLYRVLRWFWSGRCLPNYCLRER